MFDPKLYGNPLRLKDQIQYSDELLAKKQLASTKATKVILFAFNPGQKLNPHTTTGDAVITVLEGNGHYTVAEQEFNVAAGETIIIPAGTLHAVTAVEQFKMLLMIIFPAE